MPHINCVSDLHFDMSKIEPDLPGGEVLVLAGDICEARHFRKYIPGDPYFDDPNVMSSNKGRFNIWLSKTAAKYNQVIMVAGNHEHYGFTFDKTLEHMKANVPDSVTVLNNELIEIDDVVFIGATLWTDINRGDPLSIQITQYGMNDYSHIRKVKRNEYMKLRANDTIVEHIKTLAYFREVLSFPNIRNKKIVVVTHHAPSTLSVSPGFEGDSLNCAFHSDLSEFILDHPQINLWVHGHLHSRFDYKIGDTRIVCNSRGYQSWKGFEVTDYDPNFTVTI